MAYSTEDVLRRLALFLLICHLPCDYPYKSTEDADYPQSCGKEKFQQMTNNVWMPSDGSTCEFTASWLLWSLGYRDGCTFNHTDTARNNKHAQEKDMHIVCSITNNIANLIGWNSAQLNACPKMGDIVWITQDNEAPENDLSHVFIFLSQFQENGKTYWLTAEGGQPNPVSTTDFSQENSFMCFNRRLVTVEERKLKFQDCWVHGWIDLMHLPFANWTWTGGLPMIDPHFLAVLPEFWSEKRLGCDRYLAQQMAIELAIQEAFNILSNWPYPSSNFAAGQLLLWIHLCIYDYLTKLRQDKTLRQQHFSYPCCL
ncbi:hypothetical protein WA1_47605 [Scytonema hofmannii PCC 7110]|uniref:Uncharacterized protein n=1 Tax=Scytonema hofmannii PCC 7110 TaxID=128403 RepID=A0A139WXW7_9CYAN|nr:hypothetical protein [Scytonema hofmannii]KYC37289.1 hypothetical protein WA1_47605 [Scytonema hofmannii PCC 7110]